MYICVFVFCLFRCLSWFVAEGQVLACGEDVAEKETSGAVKKVKKDRVGASFKRVR